MQESNPAKNFISSLIDWKGFEQFVADLYKDSEQVTVEHNVTEVGKSGAKRQIDVRVYQKTKLHTLKIIIECKRWKDKVDRQVLDVLASGVDDLNASKGVIFTTKGYEEGAIQYAKSKNIDIFIVRDVREDEWGKPGRYIWFYLQYFNTLFGDFSFSDYKYFSLNGELPKNLAINFRLGLSPNQTYQEEHQLYSLSGAGELKGPNLGKLLIDVRNELASQFMASFNHLLETETESPELVYDTIVHLNIPGWSVLVFR
jgi:hypothetical protein